MDEKGRNEMPRNGQSESGMQCRGMDERRGGMVFRTMDKAKNGMQCRGMDEIKTGTMAENEKEQWHWQEQGTAWKGVGIYHVTLTVTSREPLLGRLVIPENDPKKAMVERTELGDTILECQREIATFHPEIQVLQYSLMPDHLHSIWYVRQPMKHGIRYAVQGFWRAMKKIGHAYTYLQLPAGTMNEKRISLSSIAPPDRRDNPLLDMIGADEYMHLDPLFHEMPFVRPLSRRGQLNAMINYVMLNPQRLATKRMMPECFRVQEGIEIAGRKYSGVGNVELLQRERYMPVHVRRTMVEDAEIHGYDQPLRDYMNGCVVAARQGSVMVSPFISKQEQAVMAVLLKEELPFIYIADNGLGDYYKPSAALFDAVAAKRVLILSPWDYDPDKKHVSRADCVAMNQMAEEIAGM